MSESLALADMGGAPLTEGIRFPYGQADELLKRHREARAGAQSEGEPSAVSPSSPEPTIADYTLVERFEPDIHALMAELGPYRAGSDAPILADPSDRQLVDSAEALRRILRIVHGVPFALGTKSGPTLDVHLDVEQVAGYVAGVRGRAPKGEIRARLKVGTVEADGRVVGVDLEEGS